MPDQVLSTFHTLSYLIHSTTLCVYVLMIPISQMRKLRLRGGKCLSLHHIHTFPFPIGFSHPNIDYQSTKDKLSPFFTDETDTEKGRDLPLITAG